MPTKTYNTPTTTPIEPIAVVAGILQNQMDLKASQIVFAYQNYNIPKDGLLIVVGYLGPSEMIASQNYFDPSTNNEYQSATFRHTIQIDIMSLAPDNSARIRKEEIALALRSSYSIQQQEKNNMGIAWLQSDFTDATSVEETVMLNRYITTCSVNALHQKTVPVGYLGEFSITLNTESEGGVGQIVDINPAVKPF